MQEAAAEVRPLRIIQGTHNWAPSIRLYLAVNLTSLWALQEAAAEPKAAVHSPTTAPVDPKAESTQQAQAKAAPRKAAVHPPTIAPADHKAESVQQTHAKAAPRKGQAAQLSATAEAFVPSGLINKVQ